MKTGAVPKRLSKPWQRASMQNRRSLEPGNPNGLQVLLLLVITIMLFLELHDKMCSVRKVYIKSALRQLCGTDIKNTFGSGYFLE